MNVSDDDRLLILGALDSLGCALADHDHQWSIGEREIYEQAIEILRRSNDQPNS